MLPFIKIYRMSLILTGYISLDSTFNRSYMQLCPPVLEALFMTVHVSDYFSQKDSKKFRAIITLNLGGKAHD